MRWTTPCLVGVFAALSGCTGAAEPSTGVDSGTADTPGWTAPDGWGPYGVGLTTVTWTDPRGKELTADVWYPAITDADDVPARYEPFTLTLDAVRDAQPDVRGGPHPLVAFSHGFAAIRFQSAFLMEHLASHGWVLVAPDHERNTFLDIDPDATGAVVVERPGDIRAAVDHLLSWSEARDDGWAGLVDGSRYVMMGHSFGALTTLVVGGGTVDLRHIRDMCGSGAVDSMACQFIDDIDPEGIVGTVEADPRAELIVPLSPGVWYGFGREGEGLATAAPALVMGGTFDDTLPYESEVLPTFEALAGPRTLATFEGAGHYVFSDICLIAPFITQECEGGDGWIELGPAQDVTRALVAAWLDVHFRGELRSEPWLREDGHRGVGFLSIEDRSR